MSINFNEWMGDRGRIDLTARSTYAWERIEDNPTSITIVRNDTPLAAQVVRIEITNQRGTNQVVGAVGISGKQVAIIFGVRGHPVVADTNIRHDDRFAVDGVQYRVISVAKKPGELHAVAEALS